MLPFSQALPLPHTHTHTHTRKALKHHLFTIGHIFYQRRGRNTELGPIVPINNGMARERDPRRDFLFKILDSQTLLMFFSRLRLRVEITTRRSNV